MEESPEADAPPSEADAPPSEADGPTTDGEPPEDTAEDETLGGRDSTEQDIEIATDALLDTLPQPAFIVDTRHRVVRDDRTQTLANAVVDHPDRADETFGADRSGRDQRAYEVEQELENADGDVLYVHSTATPIYQQGELQGVIQLIQDNTEVIRRREALDDLVRDVGDTAQRLEDGDLDARVGYTDDHDVLDDGILEITDAVNAIADATEGMVTGLVDQIDDLSD